MESKITRENCKFGIKAITNNIDAYKCDLTPTGLFSANFSCTDAKPKGEE